MVVSRLNPSTIGHEQQRALERTLSNQASYGNGHLSISVPRPNAITIPDVGCAHRSARRIHHAAGCNAAISSHEAPGRVILAKREELHVPRVKLAPQRPGVREVRPELASLVPALLLCQQIPGSQQFSAGGLGQVQ